MILGLASLAAANAAVFLAARALVGRFGTGSPHVDLVLLLAARLGLISLAMLAAGVAGVLTPWALGAAGLLVTIALLLLRKRVPSPAWPRMDGEKIFMALLGLVGLRLLLQVWFFAPYNYDAVSYHLTKIPEWVRAGGFVREMGVDTHATFPAGFELVELWWVVFLRHDVLIEMAGVEFLALVGASALALARELGLSERASSWAALATVVVPGLNISATSCLNDVPIAALVLATMVLLRFKGAWPWLALVGGLGVGIKPTYGYAIPGFLLLWWWGRKDRRDLRPLPWTAAGAIGLMGAIAGLFWYVRNTLWFGNPVHPVGTRGLVGGTGQLKIQVGPSLESGWRNLMALLNQRVHDDSMAYGALLNHLSGWGAAAFACGGVALWIWGREDRRIVRVLVASLVSMLAILFLVNHDPWCLRFVLFVPVILVLAAVWFAARSRAARWILGGALAFQWAATLVPVDLRLEHAVALARMPWRERSFGAVLGSMPATLEPVVFRVIEPVHDRGESYILYGPDYRREVVYFRGKTAEDLAQAIEEHSARWVYSARVNPKGDPLLAELIRRKALVPESARLHRRP